MATDGVIDESVVRVSPDLTGFRKKLLAGLKTATSGVEAKVRLVADATGWATSVKSALAGHQTTVRLKLTPDATGWATSVRTALAGKTPEVKVRLVADTTGLGDSAKKATRAAAGRRSTTTANVGDGDDAKVYRRIRNHIEGVQRAEDQGYSTRFKRTRGFHEDVGRAEDQAYRDQAKRDRDALAGRTTRLRNSGEALAAAHAAALREQGDREVAAEAATFRRVRTLREKLVQAEGQAREAEQSRELTRVRNDSEAMLRLEEQAHQANEARTLSRVRDTNEKLAHIQEQAYAEDRRRAKAAQDKLDQSAREAEREQVRRQRESLRNRKAAANPILRATEANGIIDTGGRGVRPTNLLIGALVALSPAILNVASSAAFASTSIAALGAATIGAAAGVTALTVGFTRVRETLKLREQVRTEEARSAASASADAGAARSRARAVVAANRSVRDSLRGIADARRDARQAEREAVEANKAVGRSYREAAEYVRDLRLELADLALQEQQDVLDVESARERLAAVNRNFWSTDLERRQAALDVQKALNSQGDTSRDRVAKQKELNKLDREGIGQSKIVLDAKRAAADADRRAQNAQDNLIAARERAADATLDLADAQRTYATGGTAASAAASDLAAKIAAMSPAARETYFWFEKNEKVFNKLRARMEEAVNPGFLTFLRGLQGLLVGKDGVLRKVKGPSALDLMADQAEDVGKILADTLGRIGELTTTKWFRSDMGIVGDENVKAFTLLGRAAEALVKPLSTIVRVSAPLFTRFSGWLLDISERFAAFIDKADRSGALVKWFKDAGDEAAKWGAILGNLLGFLRDVFSASLPSGQDLVSRIRDATGALNAWSSSPEGMASLQRFFEFFRDIDYSKLRDFVAQFGVLIASLKLFTFARKHPFWAMVTLLASADMQASADIMARVGGALSTVLTTVNNHPVAAASLLAIFMAAKNVKSFKIGLDLIGAGGLSGKLDKIFGQHTGVMTVHAGVVNVLGGGGAPGKTPPIVATPGGKPGKTPLGGKVGGAALVGGPLAVAVTGISIIDAVLYHGDEVKRFFTMDLPNWLVRGERGWSSFKDAFTNTFGEGTTRWFSTTLPNALNLGVGKGQGWAGLANNLGHWFSHTLPDAISGTPGGGWSGAGAFVWKQFKDFVGISAVQGAWQGISEKATWFSEKVTGWWESFLGGVKRLLGIASPSTVFAGFGANLIEGLWQGFTTKWASITGSVTAFINDTIGATMRSAFRVIGNGARAAFVAPFDTLTNKLAAPVGKALAWLDTNVIDKLNKVLAAIGLPGGSIPNINSALGTTVGGAGGNAIGAIGAVVRRADGGMIHGNSPHSRADNIPAMVTANEYVLPVKAVKKYGVGMMDAIRNGTYPHYADGGLVASMYSKLGGKNFVNNVTAGAISSMGGDSISAIADNIAGQNTAYDLTGTGQLVGSLDVARIAEAQARNMGASNKQLLALIEAGIVESGMRNINYGDRDSIGFLQQRAGWGSRAERMNVAIATAKFIRKARRVERKGMTAGQLAQAVQVSAFPHKYDLREADAYAIINNELPGIPGGPGPGVTVGGFPPWPRGYPKGDSGVWRNVRRLIKSSGINQGSFGNGYRHGDRLWHGSGRAVDWMGYNMDRLATWLAARNPLELIHRTKKRDYAYTRGKNRGKFNEQLMNNHRNHIHIAMADGGLVPNIPMRKYDTGGVLPPGFTMAFNGTGKNETIRTEVQEKNLNTGVGTQRLDRRDMAVLAQYIAAASARSIDMDGRRVAEAVADYSHLPGGF